ncbi:MAG: insulinase family protein [Campylobacterales bacterium]|nr:insulinase family protein [Campylobacterales bacterium]
MAATIDKIDVNGVNVPFIYEQDKRLPLTTTQIIFTNSGSIKNTQIAGLSGLSAKLLNEGTKKLGSSAFADILESKAISISANAGTETFVLEASGLKEEYAEGMHYLQMLLQDPNYSKEALSKIKTITLGNISRKENDFDYIASNELKKLLFEDGVLGKPSSGTKESVTNVELSDIETFVKQNLVVSKAIVVVGGDIDVDEVKKRMQELLSILPTGSSEETPHFAVRNKPESKILKRETEQAYVYFGAPYNINESSEEFYKARVATYILGTGGFGSRLMEEIRVKRGLAYSAYTRVNATKSSNYLTGYLQTKLDSMDEAVTTVKEVIGEFVKNGVSEDELEQTKKFLLGSEPLRVETMSQRLNRTFMEYYKGFALGHSQKELEKIRTLTLDELNSFIQEHKEILELSFSIVTK